MTAVPVAVTPLSGAVIVTEGVDVYCDPLLMIVMDVTVSPSRVAKAVATSPFGPAGLSIVTDGVEVYPLPPLVIVMDSTDL